VALWAVVAAAFATAALRSTAQETAKPAEPTAKALTRDGGDKSGDQGGVDTKLPAYQVVAGIEGNLNSIGSDTLNELMTDWTQAFAKRYPGVRPQVEGKGSGTAPPALIAGTSQLGPMSRPMKKEESDAFEKKFGYPPTRIRVAIDALAVYVNKDNPIQKLTLAQVDAIFGKQRKKGLGKDVVKWGELGLTGEWADRPISLYGRNSVSGTYGFFKEHVLDNGDYKDTVKEQAGSASVVLSVTEDRGGVGYSGIGYWTSGVRPVPLAKDDASEAYGVSAAEVYGQKYPIWRFLYVYVNQPPKQPIAPLVKEFITFVLSKEGQEVTAKNKYFPLTAKIAAEDLKQIH
jgi:phosphate transport system substrate-binding protein